MNSMIRSSKLALFILALTAAGTADVHAKTKKNPDSGLKQLSLKSGDERGNDIKALKTEMLIAQTEEKAIAQTEKLIKKYKGTPLEADLLLRQAELYMRRAKTDRFLEIQRKSDDMIQLAPRLIKSAQSKAHVSKAIAVYDNIEKRFPNFERLDQAIFNNAFASQQIGDAKKAEKLFLKVIHDFPSSSLIPDANLAAGEMRFQRREFAEALKHFQAIKKFPDSNVYPYGLYKAAWTYYNMRDSITALKELEAVVQYGRFVKEQGIDARLDLRKEALADMTLFFEEVMPSKNAYSYFEKQAGEIDVAPFILKLSDLYRRHSRDDDNRILLTEMIRKIPMSDTLPKAYVSLAEATEKTKKPKDVISLLEDLHKVCNPSSKWSKNQQMKPDSALFDLVGEEEMAVSKEPNAKPLVATDICTKVFRKTSLMYANKWLKTWQRTPEQVANAESAEEAFKLYLSEDDKSEESNRARYVYADLMFKREKYRPASENYAQTGDQTKDKSLGHDARYYAIVSLEKATKDKWSDKDEDLFRKLSAAYLKDFPKGQYALDIEFKKALIAYEKTRYEEAAVHFKVIGEAHPNTDKGTKSQDLYMDILNIKKNYAELRDYSFNLREKAPNAERKAKMNKLYEESYFLIVQELEKKGDDKEAIVRYDKFAELNPTSPLAQKSLWNSMQLQFKLGDLVAGARGAIAYHAKYPGTKEGQDALLKAAQTYEALGLLSDAAATLNTLANSDTANKSKWRLMAADYYTLLGDFKTSRPIYEELKNKGGDIQARSLDQLDFMTKAEGQTGSREALLREISALGRQPQASLAQLYFIEKAWDKKDYETVFSLSKKLVGSNDKDASKFAMASARLYQARVLDKEYRDQSLKSKVDRVHIVLQLKTEKLSKAQVAFQSAANYGAPSVSVKALSELADSYSHYVTALREMPIPTGVPAEEEAAFRAEINKLSIPMEEKAIETKNLALKQAVTSQLHDGTIPMMAKEIDKLNQSSRFDSLLDVPSPMGLVMNGSSLLPQAYPTQVNPLACPSSDKTWKKESLANLIEISNKCVGLKKWDRVNTIAKFVSVEFLKEPWGPYYLSLAAFEKGQYPLSLWYSDLANKRRSDATIVYQKARAQWALGDANEAVKTMKIAAEKKSFVEANLFMGRIHYRDSDLKSAGTYFENVVADDANNAVALVGLAEMKRKKGDLKEAISYMERAVNWSPRTVDYRLRLADLYESESKFSDALNAYKRLRSLMTETRQSAASIPVNLEEKIKTLESQLVKLSQTERSSASLQETGVKK